MIWIIEFHDDFEAEFAEMPIAVQDTLYKELLFLEQLGAHLGRPKVDTLKGSLYSNMKELRFKSNNGEWRLAFAFDPLRKAILLVAGDKKGKNQRYFYEALIHIADTRFKEHLQKTLAKSEDSHHGKNTKRSS